MRKSEILLLSSFALVSMIAVGCGDQKNTQKRGRVTVADKARQGKAGKAADAAAAAAALEAGAPVATSAVMEQTVDQMDKYVAGRLAGSQAVTLDDVKIGTYQLVEVINVDKATSNQNLAAKAKTAAQAESIIMTGHTFGVTVDAAGEASLGDVQVFGTKRGANSDSATVKNIPIKFVVARGQITVSNAVSYASQTVKGATRMAKSVGDKDKGHVLVELQNTQGRKLEGSVYTFATAGGGKTMISLKATADHLIISRDEQKIATNKTGSFSNILIYKKVSDQTEATGGAAAGAAAASSAAPVAPGVSGAVTPAAPAASTSGAVASPATAVNGGASGTPAPVVGTGGAAAPVNDAAPVAGAKDAASAAGSGEPAVSDLSGSK